MPDAAQATRPVLVLARGRAGAALRLSIWLAIVGGFYAVILGGAATDAQARWLLVLVPLFLAPYLVDAVRVLARGERHAFDPSARVLCLQGGERVPFDDIRRVELVAVNGGCEELTLQVRLLDGRAIALATGDASTRMVTLAQRAADAAGVPLVRGT